MFTLEARNSALGKESNFHRICKCLYKHGMYLATRPIALVIVDDNGDAGLGVVQSCRLFILKQQRRTNVYGLRTG
jgi:hypothetical protein